MSHYHLSTEERMQLSSRCHMEKELDLNKLSYKELEEKLKLLLEELKDDSLPIDEIQKKYLLAKKIIEKMEKKIDDLQKEVTNEIRE